MGWEGRRVRELRGGGAGVNDFFNNESKFKIKKIFFLGGRGGGGV